MQKNLVVCCDGTNNSLVGARTNVGCLSELAEIGNPGAQLVFYDAGVGVESDENARTGIGARLSRWSGSAFGTGLVENVEQAYLHLVRKYQVGDRIFLFGFSRGAYTVRVLAGLLQNYGLLKGEHQHLSTRVVKAFKRLFPREGSPNLTAKETAAQQARFDEARDIRERFSVLPAIHFMGIFDTVSSLGWAWDPKTFPNTRKMPNVGILRHALAIDERRAKFRTNRVKLAADLDQRQLWFAGVHSDVGGGYEPPRNRLARIPLGWMLREARAAGMAVNERVERTLGLESSFLQDEQAEQNESLKALWRALEYLPLPHREETESGWIEGRRIYRCEGWRRIADTFDAHESLQRRKPAVKNVHWVGSRHLIRYWA